MIRVSGTCSKMLSGFVVALAISCHTKEQKREVMVQDPHTYSVASEAVVNHLTWNASIDFETKTISAIARWGIQNINNADVVIFDTKDLAIEKVWLEDGDSTQFRLGEKDEILGQPLAVMIKATTKHVNIQYTTSP